MATKRSRVFLALAALFCLLPPLAAADLYWESEQVVKGVPGQPDSTKKVKNYITKNASRTDIGDKISIIKYDDMTMYNLNPADKTYTKVDMKSLGMPPDTAGMDSEKAAQAQAMLKEMLSNMKVVPTDETKTISGYTCRRYDVNFMMVNTEYWISKDVKGYKELKEIGQRMKKAFRENPILKNTNLLGMMDSLEGFPVQITNKMMGGTSTTTVSKVEQKPLPADLFEIPQDYTLSSEEK